MATMTERLVVDWIACDGRGLCTELLPELLTEDDCGYPVPANGTSAIDIPAPLIEHARSAVRECPTLALRLIPTD
jgi:ferredoxin